MMRTNVERTWNELEAQSDYMCELDSWTDTCSFVNETTEHYAREVAELNEAFDAWQLATNETTHETIRLNEDTMAGSEACEWCASFVCICDADDWNESDY